MNIIRPYRLDDGHAYHAAASESPHDVQPWMPWCHLAFGRDDADAWVRRQVSSFAERREFELLVVDHSGALLGAVGLNQIDDANQRANLGYWIRSSAAGKGHATTAVRQLVRWAHESTNLHRLEAVIAVQNIASVRVAEKAGAIREGTLRARLLLHGAFHDALMFAFVRGVNMGS